MAKRAETLRPGRPRDPEIDRAVLASALRHLAAHGYEAMSVAAVAKEAGVAKPAVYRRWANKADLATAALLQLQTEEPSARSGEVERDLRTVLRGFQRNLFRPNGMAMIGMLLSAERQAPELIALFRERITKRRRRMVRAVLEEGAARGEVRADADLDVAVNLLVGSFYAKYLADGKAPRDWPERIVATVLGGIRP